VSARGVIASRALTGLTLAAPVAVQVEHAQGEDCADELSFGTAGASAYGGMRLEY
jgi:hypothetical protein